jgi:GNAT superfamily N-acetyltransferase
MTAISIRKATSSDVRYILRLIKELAIYEKEPDAVVITEEVLLRDGFGENPLFYCYVAETADGRIPGMALYYIKYSTWKGPCVFLEDIIVSQSERRTGIGKMLFEKVIEETKSRGALRMEWQVLDWNTPAIKFYERYQPEVLKEWLNYRLSGEQLSGTAG